MITQMYSKYVPKQKKLVFVQSMKLTLMHIVESPANFVTLNLEV